MPLRVRRSGPREDTSSRGSVVFIHGFPFNSSMWQHQLAAMPRGWLGLAPDLRGFGETELPVKPDPLPTGSDSKALVAEEAEVVLTMERHARDLAELIDQEVGSPAVICGLSMGGYIALELWRLRPDLVRALVLTDTRADADTEGALENRRRLAATARERGSATLPAAMIPSLLAKGTRADDPEAVQLVRDMILDAPVASVIGALAGMADRSDFTAELPSIDRPALVVAGEEDSITPPQVAEEMARALPDSRLEVIPGAGHLTNLEQPYLFNRLLADFLDTLG